MNAEGKDIISLAIGSPDMPPSQQTIDKLCEVAHQPNAHGYQPTQGTPELREAMAGFYKRWYDVDLDPATEVLPLIGSKEGILHVTLPRRVFCTSHWPLSILATRCWCPILAILHTRRSRRFWVQRL